MIQTLLTIFIAALLLLLLRRQWHAANAKTARAPYQYFKDILPLLGNPPVEPGQSIGSWKILGPYCGETFQIQIIVDTLATRKLPGLWLMVTLPKPQNITATLDLMMRPSGPSTFSNFDFLPHTIASPHGFPEHGIIRSSSPEANPEIMRPYLALLHGSKGKELLLKPEGLRFVLLVTEADRARYGVFREADFGDTLIDAEMVRQAMNSLIALQNDLDKQ